MRRPYFPVGPEVFTADVTFLDIGTNDRFNLTPDIKITTAPLNHPGGATGYRVDFAGSSFACITDTEHIPGKLDRNVLELIDKTDTFIYDSSLTDEELPDFAGYGHSTYEEGVRLCKEANARSFMAFHHMPFRHDDELDLIEKKLKSENPGNRIAREGFCLKLRNS